MDPQFEDEDILAVRKAFQVFSSAVGRNNGNLQIIILDHAARNVWGNIRDVNLVEEWREGRKLVPEQWLLH